MKIWVDGDACPNVIKDIIYKAVFRLKIHAYLVANSFLKIPVSEFLHLVQVEKKFDGADAYIVDNLDVHDLVITADIPLADHAVKKGCIAINPRGEQYTESNISEKLSMRNYMQVLREGRIIQGGAGGFSDKDKQLFAAAFDRYTTLILKKESKKI
ncbi:MAG: YaiI/YqxD family protein [Proteobacteria bacterium]|nr:YaiI/YqxD family protein [Pseudomonadota bacterium]